MPKLHSRSSIWQCPADGSKVVEVSLEGFIDAASYETFERALSAAHETGHRFAIIDFTHVHYINSTGISAIIRSDALFRSRNGALCLANVAKPVGLSMHLLGLTSFLPFLKDVAAARQFIQDSCQGRGAITLTSSGTHLADELGAGIKSALKTPKGTLSPRRIPLRRRNIPGIKRAKVLVITPVKSRFTRILRLRFSSLNGDYHLVHDIRDALERYEELSPDLVVVDDRSDPKGDFVNRIKIQKKRSLTSIIKMYPRRADLDASLDFKIWENDYLVEPFEVLELFTLTEAELVRVPKDKKVFQQQVHFEFKMAQDNLEKACKLCDLVIHESIMAQEDAAAFYAAVKEGLDNSVIHGNHSESSRSIDVNILVDKKKLIVLIEDQGGGFDYEYYLSRIDDKEAFEKAKKHILENGERGGLGILLMRKCSDRIEYSGCGNILRLEKHL